MNVTVGNDSTVVTQEELGIAVPLQQPELVIRPNPADEVVRLAIPDHQIVSWQLYSLKGELLKGAENLSHHELAVKTYDLAEGIYLLRVRDDNGNLLNGKLTILR